MRGGEGYGTGWHWYWHSAGGLADVILWGGRSDGKVLVRGVNLARDLLMLHFSDSYGFQAVVHNNRIHALYTTSTSTT